MLRGFAFRRELTYARDLERNDGLIVVRVIFSYTVPLPLGRVKITSAYDECSRVRQPGKTAKQNSS